MAPKIQVEFIMTGIKVDPDEITRLLSLKPTRIWLIGESIQGTNLRRKHNGWCFSLEKRQDSFDLEEYILPLVRTLRPNAHTIKRISKEYGLSSEISCVIYITDETPIINLRPEVISEIAELNAAIDIDIILTK